MNEAGGARRRDGFYGRRKARALKPGQAAAVDKVLGAIGIDTSAPADVASLFPGAVDAIALEIGFGGGEHLVRRVESEPATGRIGVEPFLNGFAKAAAAIERTGLVNIRLFDRDATELLDWLPPASLDRVDLLYPDPWPKTRHQKRRFVSPANLDRLARVLKPGGLFCFASDIDSYVDWTLALLDAHPDFDWTARDADDWRLPWPDWPGTRYERKAIAAGRRGTYLTFRRL